MHLQKLEGRFPEVGECIYRDQGVNLHMIQAMISKIILKLLFFKHFIHVDSVGDGKSMGMLLFYFSERLSLLVGFFSCFDGSGKGNRLWGTMSVGVAWSA